MATVQSAEINANGVTSQTLAFGSGVTAGNAVVAGCAIFNSTLNAFTDNNGGVYQLAASAGDGTPGMRFSVAPDHPAGATTVTADPAGTGDIYFVIAEDDEAVVLEAAGSAGGTSSTPSVTSATLLDPNAVAYGLMTHGGFNQTITENGSLTLVQEHEGGTTDMPGSMVFKAAGGSTSAITFSWTTGSSQEWLAAYVILASVLLYPVIGTVNGSASTNLNTAPNISPPTGTVAGDLLIAWLTSDNTAGTDITVSAGWDQLFHTENGTIVTHAAFARIADGGANDTLNPAGAAQDYCAEVVRITNHGVTTVTTDIVVATPAQAASGNANPPSLNPGSSKDWLFLASCGVDFTTGNTISADPANYNLVSTRTSASSTSSCGQRISYRNLTTGSAEDPGTFTNTSQEWVAATIAVPPPGAAPPNEGTGDGSIAWAGSVTGARTPKGAATGSITWAGSTTGVRVPKGAATGAIAWVGTVDGEAPVIVMDGAANGTIAWAGTVTGTRTSSGAATGSITWAGDATGTSVHSGSAAGSITWAGTSTGVRVPKGAATGAVDWVGSATGETPAVGVNDGEAVGAITWVGTVTGTTLRTGSATGDITWAGTSTGVRVPKGAATGAITWAGEATGESPAVGINDGEANGAITWVGTATGQATHNSAVTGAVDWVGSATGQRIPKAAATGAITWAGTVTGESPAVGIKDGEANGSIAWAGTATGQATHLGAVVGNLAWAGAATGLGDYAGTAIGTIAWTGEVTGQSVTDIPAGVITVSIATPSVTSSLSTASVTATTQIAEVTT